MKKIPKTRGIILRNITGILDTCKNCAKCEKGLKIGTNEAYNIQIKMKVGGILKIFYFCLYANMAASNKGI